MAIGRVYKNAQLYRANKTATGRLVFLNNRRVGRITEQRSAPTDERVLCQSYYLIADQTPVGKKTVKTKYF